MSEALLCKAWLTKQSKQLSTLCHKVGEQALDVLLIEIIVPSLVLEYDYVSCHLPSVGRCPLASHSWMIATNMRSSLGRQRGR